MAWRFLSKLSKGKKNRVPDGVFPCADGCYICGNMMEDGSMEGNKYRKDQLVACGRFVDGKLSGFGQRYVDGQILCQGHFEEGHLSGEGKLYSDKGFVIYEGNFARRPNNICSAYHGSGREYHYKTGVLLYVGEFHYNRWMGRGKEYYPNGQLRYEGEFLDCFWHGQGVYYDEEGNQVYAGDFKGVTVTQDR